jgi:hypothetical protein
MGGDVPGSDFSGSIARLAERNRRKTEADILADVCALLLYGGFDLGDEQSAWSRWRPIVDALTSMSVEPVTV